MTIDKISPTKAFNIHLTTTCVNIRNLAKTLNLGHTPEGTEDAKEHWECIFEMHELGERIARELFKLSEGHDETFQYHAMPFLLSFFHDSPTVLPYIHARIKEIELEHILE